MAELTGESAVLLAGLKEQLEAYIRIQALSKECLSLVKEAEVEKATSVLSRKQDVLSEIAAVEERIRPLKAKWPQFKASLSTEAQTPFHSVLKELSNILESLIYIERETEDILSSQIAVVRKKPVASVTEDSVRKAYGTRKEGGKRD